MTAAETGGGSEREVAAEATSAVTEDEATEVYDSEVVEEVVETDSEEGGEQEPDYKDLYLRQAAEADNIRKRARRDVEQASARGVARLARELLPSLDNLDRALQAAEAEEGAEDHHLTEGIRLVQKELLAAFVRVGIEQYSPVGEVFDPHLHEAVAQVPADGVQSGTITNVVAVGYRYRDEILRAAKVTVAP